MNDFFLYSNAPSNDGDKDTLKGGKGDDELFGGVGDKLKP